MTTSSFADFKDIAEVLDDITIDDDITINESKAPHIIDFKDLHLREQEDEHKEDNDGTNTDDQDDWNVLNSPVEDDLYCDESEWDVLSSIQSVMSMETFHSSQIHRPTYSAIVSKHSSIDNRNQFKRRERFTSYYHDNTKILPRMKKVPVIKDITTSDYDDREGYKYARGGKDDLKFRGNPHQKRRGGRRRESRNFRKEASTRYTY